MLLRVFQRTMNSSMADSSSGLPQEACTLDICNITSAYIDYVPSLPGNVLYLVIFILFILPHLYLGLKHRTFGFSIAMAFGFTLEVAGYIGRIQMHSNPFIKAHFILNLIGLTVGPVFIAAGIYLCLSRIIIIYDPEERFTLLRARSYLLIFCACDIASLVLQSIGGSWASDAETLEETKKGTHMMVTGLAVQVASLLLFMTLCLEFGLRVRRQGEKLDLKHQDLQRSPRFKQYLFALAFATLCILVRSVYRVAELSGGFSGPLANNQVLFMVLDGMLVVLASAALTFLHPGIGFQGRWKDGNWNLRDAKPKVVEPHSPINMMPME